MKIAERNHQARYFVNAKLGHVSTMTESDFASLKDFEKVSKMLTDLIDVQAKGFRGVVLTAIVGMQLNKDYNPLIRFYDCNPRAIFEDGIWHALSENGIPSGKSDPLNVAKNTYELNESWAQGKRPVSAAFAAVSFLNLLVHSGGTEREQLTDYFFFRLLAYARINAAVQPAVSENPEDSRQVLASRLTEFCLAHPESGMVPQLLVAKLLTKVFEMSEVVVSGGEESVFGTNTTSKKPADVWTEISGEPLCLFEVTVKPISEKRLIDCIESLSAVDQLTKPTIFICRIPDDIEGLQLHDNTLSFRGKTFEFLDIREFCRGIAATLRPEQMSDVVEDLRLAVASINVSLATRRGWNTIMNKE